MPRNMVIDSTAIISIVAAAFCASGGLNAGTPFETASTVSCIVPGHDRPGTELINDEVVVNDPPFEFELHATCAFRREFDYSG